MDIRHSRKHHLAASEVVQLWGKVALLLLLQPMTHEERELWLTYADPSLLGMGPFPDSIDEREQENERRSGLERARIPTEDEAPRNE